MKFLHSPSNNETITVAYPLISDIVANVFVLPVESAGVEGVFLATKRIRTPIRNRLNKKYINLLIA